MELPETLPQEAPACRREAVQEYLVHELVAETEAEAVDTEDATLAQAFELLGELGGVGSKQPSKRLRLEGRLEHRRGNEDAIGGVALSSELGQQRFRQVRGELAPVADQENERRLLGDHLGQRLERLDVRELPALLEGELGQDPSQRGSPARVELDAVQSVAQCAGERHVGKVLLELGTAPTADADARQARRQLVEEPRLSGPGLTLDEEQRKGAVQCFACRALERVELALPPEQAHG